MQLRDWLEREKVTQRALGERMVPAVSQGKVCHWLNGTRRVSLGEALQLVAITGGEVTYAELWAMYRGAANEAAAMQQLGEARDAA